ncbi:MAG: tetratricopeptide repeat-containing sulfotransferase family protein [Burkholderiales bacterium]
MSFVSPVLVQDALDAGDFDEATRLCEEGLRDAPSDPDAHRYLAFVHAARSHPQLAVGSARRACQLAGSDPRAWSDLGRVHVHTGRLANAVECFRRAVEIDSSHADGWHNLGTALKQMGEPAQAFAALKNALHIDPTRAETYLNLGNLLIAADQFDDAVECFERAAKYDPKMAQARSHLAQELSSRGKVKRAETLFRQSLGLKPDHIQSWFGLGRTLEDLGEAEGALGCYANILRLRPGHPMALGHYLSLARGEIESDGLERARAALRDNTVQDEAKALIGYGLAKYYDRRGQYRDAARAGELANAARRRKIGPLDRDKLAARVDGVIETYTAEFFAERRRFGVGTNQPVFIVGLPRSGTTLTEQILAAHPWVHGAGELPTLSRLAACALADPGDPSWHAAMKLDRTKSRELAYEYLRALRDGAPKGRLRISDKSPLNFFHLAFAALLFPGARVIHCQRESRDNALSIWMENFNTDQRYATDFDDLAFYTAQYKRLMAHWRAVLPLPSLEVQYEEMVADVEAQARRLMEFLGAPWDARCLDFDKSERAVQTPSRWQVRQPIYSRSVGRWKTYAEQLPHLSAAFDGAELERSE